jgi:hypothetical protein
MNKKLAYILGVFLGDGSICSDKRTFALQAIDLDFVEKTADALRCLSKNNVIVSEEKRLTTAGRRVFSARLSDVNFCNIISKLTFGRKNIPIDFNSWDKIFQNEFISGILDSDGYVSKTKVHSYNGQEVADIKIGVGACDTWIYELHRFCQESGIKVGVITREKLKSGKIFAKFIFNKKSFIENGLYFNIKRKQDRIENYKILFPGSTTKRIIPKTEYTKNKISEYSKTRIGVGGKFVKMGNDIV